MFEKLKKKWNVNSLNLLLVIITFALGGSLCGYAGRKILLLTNLEEGITWVIVYILLVTLLWPICVLLISIPFGQFTFFRSYVLKIGRKITGHKIAPVRIAIFASGAGSNAGQIVNYFANSTKIKVSLIVCNKAGAGVITIAENANIPALLISKESFFLHDHYKTVLETHQINFIVLAGFLWKIPDALISMYPKKIINIHPALLPKYGGKGLYGHYVHDAVIAAGEKESGITIHYVDGIYDHGEIIFQASCEVMTDDSPETLAQRIYTLEHKHFAAEIEKLLVL